MVFPSGRDADHAIVDYALLAAMKLKELHSLMQDIEPFPDPKIALEQYPTGPHLASRLLFTVANSYDEVEGQTVVDLGCGTGMLAIGAAMLGSPSVVGLDVDPDALATAQRNVDKFEGLDAVVDLCLCDVRGLAAAPQPPGQLLRQRVDTVVMNPPFGTRAKGADSDFVRAAFRISRGTVYSLHKSSTRAHIQRLAVQELGAPAAEVLAELRYDLPPTYAFHKSKSKDIEVDLWRFEVPPQP